MKTWAECQRCERHHERLGVYSASWPAELQVVVLGVRASWAGQVVGADDRRVGHLVHVLRERLCFSAAECVGDVLVACGAGEVVLPDHVAACSARHVESAAAALPKLIVFANRRAEALARAAGEIDGGFWMPFGFPRGVRHVVADEDFEALVHRVGHALGRRPRCAAAPLRGALAGAQAITAVLGDHAGARVVSRAGDRSKHYGRVSEALVEEHLVGACTVQVVHTRGPWPFIAVVVGRSSPAQVASFDEVLKRILAALPRSFAIEKVNSGDVHIYVSMPDGPSYGHGALVLRAHLQMLGVRWRVHEGESSQGTRRAVLAEVCAAPAEPPALPCGHGWRRLRSASGQAADIAAFIDWAQRRDTTDFIEIERAVRDTFGITEQWRARHRSRLRSWLRDQELELEHGPRAAGDLPADWASVAPRLTPSALLIARAGVRCHGTFARRAALLVDELATIVDRDDVERLMLEWLSKSVVDEDIAADPAPGREMIRKEIARRYRPWRGIPARFWQIIEDRTRATWARKPTMNATSSGPMTLDALIETAFLLAGKFYRARTPTRCIHYADFESFTRANTAKAVRMLLADAGVISITKDYIKGKQSRTYTIAPDLWPPRAGEFRLFRMPGPAAT